MLQKYFMKSTMLLERLDFHKDTMEWMLMEEIVLSSVGENCVYPKYLLLFPVSLSSQGLIKIKLLCQVVFWHKTCCWVVQFLYLPPISRPKNMLPYHGDGGFVHWICLFFIFYKCSNIKKLTDKFNCVNSIIKLFMLFDAQNVAWN